MRGAFISSLTELAARDPRVTLVVGDLGFGVVTEFARRFPGQFLNAGVAEQNMTGVAAGMALAGRIVFTYSIANFPTLRCLEQIRNDVCYHKANVIVTAVGGGFAYGALGMSHHATEDLAVMRALPNLTVVAPGDPHETRCAVRALAAGIGPAYLRLGRAGETQLLDDAADWQLGKANVVRRGRDLAILSTGGMLATALQAADRLAELGYHAEVLSMHTLKPLDVDAVRRVARETGFMATLEEHSLCGGLGGAVAETLVDAGLNGVRCLRFGLPSHFTSEVGDQDYFRRHFGLDVDSIVSRLASALPGR